MPACAQRTAGSAGHPERAPRRAAGASLEGVGLGLNRLHSWLGQAVREAAVQQNSTSFQVHLLLVNQTPLPSYHACAANESISDVPLGRRCIVTCMHAVTPMACMRRGWLRILWPMPGQTTPAVSWRPLAASKA